MRIIITFGPGYEPVDAVRRLTNASTGKLGTALCNFFTQQGHDVLAFRSETAACAEPLHGRSVETFSTTDDLAAKLEACAKSPKIHAVLHAAALPDFQVAGIQGEKGAAVSEAKIASRQKGLTLRLKPAPKLILKLRGWFPDARLVGWKYEMDGTREDVLARAQRQLREARTDLCVANGLAYGPGFGVCDASGWRAHVADAEALGRWLEVRLQAGNSA